MMLGFLDRVGGVLLGERGAGHFARVPWPSLASNLVVWWTAPTLA